MWLTPCFFGETVEHQLDRVCRCRLVALDLLQRGDRIASTHVAAHLHHEMALKCIERGIHVLVEKPIASNVDEGREIIAAAKRETRTV